MIREMYFQKSAQYQSGEYVEKENLYKKFFDYKILYLSLLKPFQKSHLTDSG